MSTLTVNNVLEFTKTKPKTSLHEIAAYFKASLRDIRVLMGEDWCNRVVTQKMYSVLPQEKKYGVSAKQQKKINLIHNHNFPNETGDIKCQCCKLKSWKEVGLICIAQVDHIDGSKHNDNLSNLRILCPNCHSQTITHSRTLVQETSEAASTANLIPAGNVPVTEAKLSSLMASQTCNESAFKHDLNDIITNKVAFPRTARLVKRLFANHLKQPKCEGCGIISWRNNPIFYYLHGHHADGNINNNSLKNLKVLCPNCHICEHRLPLFVVGNKSIESIDNTGKKLTRNTNQSQNMEQGDTIVINHQLQSPGFKMLVTETRTVTAVHGYNPNSERAIQIKEILQNPNRPISMTACAQKLNIPFVTFKRMARSLYPDLWAPDPGSSRRCDDRLPEIQVQIQQIKDALVYNGYSYNSSLVHCMTYHQMPKKRFMTLYKKYNLSPFKKSN